MLPLRFPNNDFRAKAARKVGGRPRPGPLQGWLATAKPPAWAVGHGLATCKGAIDCGQGPVVGATTRRGSRLQRCARRSDVMQRGAHL
ncbi:hypothetical protein B296_00045723 [Ensete ventricosum]|uniref:Uncharacterized protein n=1 Tax=Ensete ventricosum TaxID=4639 RepID=A0A426XBG2_ENSVE|nr:hypothetical protein B296_00045723 [Ensete ventricosum]